MNTTSFPTDELEKELKSIAYRHYRELVSKTGLKNGPEHIQHILHQFDLQSKELLDDLLDTTLQYLEKFKIENPKSIERIIKLNENHYRYLQRIFEAGTKNPECQIEIWVVENAASFL